MIVAKCEMENRGVRQGGGVMRNRSFQIGPRSEQALEITSQQVNILGFSSQKSLFLQAENDKSMSYRVFHTIRETLSSCFAFQGTGNYTRTERRWREPAASSLGRGEVADWGKTCLLKSLAKQTVLVILTVHSVVWSYHIVFFSLMLDVTHAKVLLSPPPPDRMIWLLSCQTFLCVRHLVSNSARHLMVEKRLMRIVSVKRNRWVMIRH